MNFSKSFYALMLAIFLSIGFINLPNIERQLSSIYQPSNVISIEFFDTKLATDGNNGGCSPTSIPTL